jgi:hypothetical protein
MKPGQVPSHHETTIVRQAIYVSRNVAHAAPSSTYREMREAGISIEVDSEPCPPRPQTEVSLLKQRRPDLQRLIEASCPFQDLKPSGEIASRSMVYLTFRKRRKATIRSRSPWVETPHPAWRAGFSSRLINAPGHHTHIWQLQCPKVLRHQRRAAADVIIHEDDCFVPRVPPAEIPGHRKTPKIDSIPPNNLTMLRYQALQFRSGMIRLVHDEDFQWAVALLEQIPKAIQ